MNLLYRDFWNTLGFILSILIPEYSQSKTPLVCAREQASALFHECFYAGQRLGK